MAKTVARSGWRKTLVNWGGLVLLLASLAYLARTIAALDPASLANRVSSAAWWLTAACALAYGASLGLLAVAWLRLADGNRTYPLARALAVYGPGVIAKYVPGSVLQYASRQVLGAQLGIGHKPMLRASLVEALLHVACALIIAGLLLVGAGLVGLGLALIAGLSLSFLRQLGLLRAAGMQIAFFALFGGMILLIAQAIGADDAARLAAVYLIAWIAGLLVPVAPGGIGVREAVLLALGAPFEAAEMLAVLAVLVRLAGIAGDGLFGLAGYGCSVRLAVREKTQASA